MTLAPMRDAGTATSDRDQRCRLDQALVAAGLADSRSRARDFILRGLVSVDGQVVGKPAALVGLQQHLAIAGHAATYVSRGAEKLVAALDAFAFDAAGRIALDIGASTGGFTQVLLARGAARVHAVDVGHGQLHARIATDPRVVEHAGLDARALTAAHVPDRAGALVADVSFISLTKALPAALALMAPAAWLVVLVKPQFEAGPDAIGRGGIVRDAQVRAAVVTRVAGWLGDAGWRVRSPIASPIAGGDGNVEYLVGAERGP